MASSALQNRVETQISKITQNGYAFRCVFAPHVSITSHLTLPFPPPFPPSDDWERRNEAIVQLGTMFKEEAPEALTVEVLRPLKLPLQVGILRGRVAGPCDV